MGGHRFLLFACITFVAGCGSWKTDQTLKAISASDLGKVDQRAAEILDSQNRARIIIHLAERAQLENIPASDWKTRGRKTVDTLRRVAIRSQASILTYLMINASMNKVVDIDPLWICNCVVVTADEDTIATLAERGDVKSISANIAVKVDDEPAYEAPVRAITSVEWNVAKIRADQVWTDFGITGNGVVVGTLDTGVQWDHPALRDKYRGWDGTAADHNYNWYDATRVRSPEPIDLNGHGTHTTGTMVGDDGAGNQVGVAPGAKWIGAAMIDSGSFWIDAAHRAFQWMIAPTDLAGNNPTPDLRPAVVNNSWGCAPPISGCMSYEEFRDDVDAWIAAGIFPEFSAGNEGPSTRSMRWPAAYSEAFSTGATTESDTIAGFSSRGPAPDGAIKPEVTAPGVSIRSSFRGSSFALMGGTSMAGPHVVGLVALLLEANPNLDIATLTNIIERTAVPFGNVRPNNTFGWGRIDAYAAVQSVLDASK